MVVTALQLMRDKRVRAVLVIEADKLVGFVTPGDCAIKVLLPGLDANSTAVKDVMTRDPAVEADRVVGVISIGDVVEDNIRNMGDQIEFLETYIKGHGKKYA
jgi:CBS domain-containing protein